MEFAFTVRVKLITDEDDEGSSSDAPDNDTVARALTKVLDDADPGELYVGNAYSWYGVADWAVERTL
jgi:hypothetical protein